MVGATIVENMSRGSGRSPICGRGQSTFAQRDGNCNYCGRYGHFERECYQKQNDSQRGRGRGRSQFSHFHQRGGQYGSPRGDRGGHLFAMQHVLDSMTEPGSDNIVGNIDFDCTNHMRCHREWFNEKNPIK